MARTTKLLPFRIRTARLELRCLGPSDAASLNAVTAANEEHLSPWMPWAHALPRPEDRTVAHLSRLRADFERGHDFNYAVLDRADGAHVGGLGLHPRSGPATLEIGYWIVRERTGRGYATEAAAAAARIGIEVLGAERIEIHVQPGNAISMRIPERLGFRREGLRRNQLKWRDGTWRDQVIWSLAAADLAGSPLVSFSCQAFDPGGAPIEPGIPESTGAGGDPS